MSRGHGGRNTARPAVVEPGSPEGREIGLSDRNMGEPSPIPGGETHIVNHQTMRQKAPTPVPRPEFRGVMAHGVPGGKHTGHERADAMRGPNSTHDPKPKPPAKPPAPPVLPVPVTIVEQDRDVRALRDSSHRRVFVPGWGNDPVPLAGKDSARTELLLLNEDSTHHVRFGKLADLATQSAGSVLPATTSSYLRLKAQGELYAIGNDATGVYVSVIHEFDMADSEVE